MSDIAGYEAKSVSGSLTLKVAFTTSMLTIYPKSSPPRRTLVGEQQTAAHFWLSLDAPCEVRLDQLARDYNALADRWEEQNERANRAEADRDLLRQRGDELAEAVDKIEDCGHPHRALRDALAAWRTASGAASQSEKGGA